jgi:hypothetical protein
MPVEHFGLAKQSDFSTWATPAHFFRINSFSLAPNRARIDGRYTGASRSLAQRWLGEKAPSGSFEMPAFPEKLGFFLLAAGLVSRTTTTPEDATNARLHCFLPDDTASLIALSLQAQYGNSIGVNVLGAVIDTLKISAAMREDVKISADFFAKDEAKCGGVWDYDGSTESPALVSSPTYSATTLRPFMFYDAAIVSGGTPAIDGTSKRMSIGSGTARNTLERIEFSIANNLDLPHFLTADPTPRLVAGQDRTITGSFDIDVSTMSTTFYDEYRAGSKIALQARFTSVEIESGQNYMLEITLPSIDFDDASFPDMTGEQSRRVRSVSFTAMLDSTTNYDIGVALRDSQTSY